MRSLSVLLAGQRRQGIQHRSVRKRFSEETVYSASTAIEILFPAGRTRTAAFVFVDWLKKEGGSASKNAVSEFADALQAGKVNVNGLPFRYSRRNFYLTILRTLVELGFVQRNVPIWDDRVKRTLYVYSRNIFDIPQKPPSVGFWRHAYYICRKWNEQFVGEWGPAREPDSSGSLKTTGLSAKAQNSALLP